MIYITNTRRDDLTPHQLERFPNLCGFISHTHMSKISDVHMFISAPPHPHPPTANMMCVTRSEINCSSLAQTPIWQWKCSYYYYIILQFAIRMFCSRLEVTLFAGFDNIKKVFLRFLLQWRLVLRSVSSNASEYFRTKETVPIPMAESVSAWF